MAATAATADVDTEDQGADKQPSKRKISLKLMIMAAAGLLLLGAVGGGAWYFLKAKGPKPDAVAVVKPPVFFDVPEVLVNLNTAGGDRTQYLKVKVVLELSDATLQPVITAVMPRVMDTFQTYLREMRPSDLEGSAGLYRLKEELTRRVNASIAPSRVNAVLFKEIVVQ